MSTGPRTRKQNELLYMQQTPPKNGRLAVVENDRDYRVMRVQICFLIDQPASQPFCWREVSKSRGDFPFGSHVKMITYITTSGTVNTVPLRHHHSRNDVPKHMSPVCEASHFHRRAITSSGFDTKSYYDIHHDQELEAVATTT